MKILDNMTIRTSWLLVLLTFTVLVLVVGGLGGYAVQYSQQSLKTFKKVDTEQKATLNKANSSYYIFRLHMQDDYRRSTQADGTARVDTRALQKELASVRALYQKFFGMDIPARHRALVAKVQTKYRQLLKQGLKPQLAALRSGNGRAYNRYAERTAALSKAFYDSEVDYFVTTEKEGAALYENFQGTAVALKVAIGAAVLVSILLILLVLWAVTVNVIRPLAGVVGHFERIADGDLSAPVEKRGRNEIGMLLAGLAHMQEGLSNTVGRVRRSSGAIHTGSESIARGNGELSSRTEQQAASLEETASSMEQLTATVSQNADNAREARQLANNASETASQGGAVVEQVIDTMRNISSSSQEIVNIISTIDSIAFQTNILALNASVEAARAGEQGRGFAVVASEVRNLASRSADAAKEIRTLIEASVERVNTGSTLVDQAGTTMGDVVSAVQRVNQIMDEIAAASEEQSRGISQVNIAITEMDQVTQQNAHMVQQASSAADDLERHAGMLREAVALFRLTDDADTQGEAASSSRPAAATPAMSPRQTRIPEVATSVEVLPEDGDLEWKAF